MPKASGQQTAKDSQQPLRGWIGGPAVGDSAPKSRSSAGTQSGFPPPLQPGFTSAPSSTPGGGAAADPGINAGIWGTMPPDFAQAPMPPPAATPSTPGGEAAGGGMRTLSQAGYPGPAAIGGRPLSGRGRSWTPGAAAHGRGARAGSARQRGPSATREYGTRRARSASQGRQRQGYGGVAEPFLSPIDFKMVKQAVAQSRYDAHHARVSRTGKLSYDRIFAFRGIDWSVGACQARS